MSRDNFFASIFCIQMNEVRGARYGLRGAESGLLYVPRVTRNAQLVPRNTKHKIQNNGVYDVRAGNL